MLMAHVGRPRANDLNNYLGHVHKPRWLVPSSDEWGADVAVRRSGDGTVSEPRPQCTAGGIDAEGKWLLDASAVFLIKTIEAQRGISNVDEETCLDSGLREAARIMTKARL